MLRTVSQSQLAQFRDSALREAVGLATSELPPTSAWECYVRALIGLELVSREALCEEDEKALRDMLAGHVLESRRALCQAGLSPAEADSLIARLGKLLEGESGTPDTDVERLQEKREKTLLRFFSSLELTYRQRLGYSEAAPGLVIGHVNDVPIVFDPPVQGPSGTVLGCLTGIFLAWAAFRFLRHHFDWAVWSAVLVSLGIGACAGASLAGIWDEVVAKRWRK